MKLPVRGGSAIWARSRFEKVLCIVPDSSEVIFVMFLYYDKFAGI